VSGESQLILFSLNETLHYASSKNADWDCRQAFTIKVTDVFLHNII